MGRKRFATVVGGAVFAAVIGGAAAGPAFADPSDTTPPGQASAPLGFSGSSGSTGASGSSGATATTSAAGSGNAGTGGGTNSAAPVSASADYTAAKAAIAAKDWATAIAKLKVAMTADPTNPDIFNYLGFAYRKSGDLTNGMKYYTEALRLNPKHKGALEYQGELYLQLKKLTPAKANLAKLKTICGTKCEEYKDLSKAIAAYKPGK